MNDNNNVIPIATLVILVVVAVIGGVVTIIHPASLAFDQYVKDVGIAFGLLAVGRGLDAGSRP